MRKRNWFAPAMLLVLLISGCTAPLPDQAAREYLRLTEKEFAEQYSAKQLWQMGAYDRLLFTAEEESSK